MTQTATMKTRALTRKTTEVDVQCTRTMRDLYRRVVHTVLASGTIRCFAMFVQDCRQPLLA